MSSDLTPNQKRFVEEYLKDLNGTQAAARAGYAEKSAVVQASRLLTNANVANAIQSAMDKRSKRTEITAEYVLTTIKGTVERCREMDEYPGVLKGCELLGRHLKLFTDKIEHSGHLSLEELVLDESKDK